MILIVRGFAIIRKRGSTLTVSYPLKTGEGEEKDRRRIESVPILDLELLVIVGSRVRLSSGTILLLSKVGVPVVFHGRETHVIAVSPIYVRIADVRRNFYRLLEDDNWRLYISRKLIEGKIRGFLNVCRYLTYKESEKDGDKEGLESLREIENKFYGELRDTTTINDVRKVEAKWSKKLWEYIKDFIPSRYNFTGRDPKSRDPINAATSYSYAIIYGLCTHALIAAGLDPYAGIMHVERAGRTALTYDFSEMFKPVAIHAVTVASRIANLSVSRNGYLNKESLKTVTKILFRNLRRKHSTWRYTVRGYIYGKAWELRINIEKGEKFKPFVYKIK